MGPTIIRPYRSVLGTISAINGNAITIVRESGSAVTVNLVPDTSIMVNSGQATLADLQQSDRAKVNYDASGNALSLVALRN